MWQQLRSELHPLGLEIVTVGLDTVGAEACRPFIERAQPEHPSLIDRHHAMAELFGVVNIPNSVWIDEAGIIVRPAESAPPPHRDDRDRPTADAVPGRFGEIMAEATGIRLHDEAYHAALRDWVEHGNDSDFALSPDDVVARSQPRDAGAARGTAHFELATHLETAGRHDAAIPHFREAHRLVPDNFSYKRQAWSMEPGAEGPLARFWQGPTDENPEAWPYAGDWLTDVKEFGAENYYPAFRP